MPVKLAKPPVRCMLSLLLLPLLVGCAPDERSRTADAVVTQAYRCGVEALAYCLRLWECEPNTAPTCQRDYVGRCCASAGQCAEPSPRSQFDTEACAIALRQVECHSLGDVLLPEACR